MDKKNTPAFPLEQKKWESNDFSNRLKEAMKNSVGFTELAKQSGIAGSTLNSYLSGRPSKIEVAIRLAEICNVDPIWLIFGVENKASECEIFPAAFNENYFKPEEVINIPLINVEASAGSGLIPSEWENAEMIPFSKDLVHQLLGMVPKNIFMMRVQGDSMMPTLQPKDALFVDYTPRDKIMQGIYVLCAGDSVLVKRLGVKDPWTYSVISDNPAYPSFDIPMKKTCWGHADTDADVRIIGRVISAFHEFD